MADGDQDQDQGNPDGEKKVRLIVDAPAQRPNRLLAPAVQAAADQPQAKPPATMQPPAETEPEAAEAPEPQPAEASGPEWGIEQILSVCQYHVLTGEHIGKVVLVPSAEYKEHADFLVSQLNEHAAANHPDSDITLNSDKQIVLGGDFVHHLERSYKPYLQLTEDSVVTRESAKLLKGLDSEAVEKMAEQFERLENKTATMDPAVQSISAAAKRLKGASDFQLARFAELGETPQVTVAPVGSTPPAR